MVPNLRESAIRIFWIVDLKFSVCVMIAGKKEYGEIENSYHPHLFLGKKRDYEEKDFAEEGMSPIRGMADMGPRAAYPLSWE